MTDPLESLKHLAEEPTGAMLPPAEVRRRGDRLHRRRAALRTLGAACVVAAITIGGIALGGDRTGSAPAPPPASQDADPTPDGPGSAEPSPVVTAIPAAFPLAEDFPADAGPEQELVGPGPAVPAFDEVTACGVVAYPMVDPAGRLATTFSQPEDFRVRELTTYADAASAGRALTSLVGAYRACPRQSFGEAPTSVTLTDVRTSGLGDEGYVVLQTYETDGLHVLGLTQLHAIRVGNSLLLSSTSNEGGADAHAIDAAVRAETRLLAPLAEAMCRYSVDGCTDRPT